MSMVLGATGSCNRHSSASSVTNLGRKRSVGGGHWRNKRSLWTVATMPFSGAHYAVFPRKLIEPCILAGSKPGHTVLDVFAGTATTGQVATDLGRSYIGANSIPNISAWRNYGGLPSPCRCKSPPVSIGTASCRDADWFVVFRYQNGRTVLRRPDTGVSGGSTSYRPPHDLDFALKPARRVNITSSAVFLAPIFFMALRR